MPERVTTGLTQATLKFAAGDDQARTQVSSTWYVRMTRGGELFLLNREAGGNRAHISVHKDGRCHYKVGVPGGPPQKQNEWEVQEPLEGTDVVRLASIAIPNLGLVLPANFAGVEEETVLIPPPAEGEQLEIDILHEPGAAPRDQWPGQTSLGTKLVGRFSLYTESPEDGFFHFTVVSAVRPEDNMARAMSVASIECPKALSRPKVLGWCCSA